MSVCQFLHSLEFDDDFVVADEIRDVFAFQRGSFVVELQPRLRNARQSGKSKLNFEALLVNGFKKARPFVLIYFEESTADGEAFVWIDEFGVHKRGICNH
jgi:hypothetical protein